MTTRIDLTEGGAGVEVRLSETQAQALRGTGYVSVDPAWGDGWLVTPKSVIGSFAVDDVEVHVAPKLPIARLLFLLGYATSDTYWQLSSVELDDADGLVSAMADAFVRQADRAVAHGLLQGYRVRRESAPTVRGRLLIAEQVTRRYGMAVPVEVVYDDYDVDIPENQILAAATRALLRVPGVRREARQRLAHLRRTLAGVSVPAPGAPIPTWTRSRLNTRYHPALALAELVLRATSIEAGGRGTRAIGFVVVMSTLFEAFVTVALRVALLERAGGVLSAQDRWTLDEGSMIPVRPDIVWYSPGALGRSVDGSAAGAVIDAKYKAERPSGYPNADLYQMLAYCTVAGLDIGHLVYARGQTEPREVQVSRGGVTLMQHALDLAAEPDALLVQVGSIADAVLARARGVEEYDSGEVG